MEAPHRHRTRLVVLASGTGSNLQAILDACHSGGLTAEVVAVVSDRDNAYALKRAADAGVPSVHVGVHADEARGDYDARLADVVAGFAPDLIVLAGWMRILTNAFLGWFPNEVINLHPALPGELPGTRAVERAWHEALAGERTRTGVMVHRVPDEGVDDGPVLASVDVPIHLDDTFESLQARIHAAEHELLVQTIRDLIRRPDQPPETPAPDTSTPDTSTDDTKATSA
jgi:formyltetrahydrofolate-dependent phosphoribosylglycinamide formyltransferase